MRYDFLRNGFIKVTDNTRKRGDVLLNELYHTALYIGNGQVVEAGINERGGISGGAVGDQTGGEIHVRSYFDYPWDLVLRYVGGETESGETSDARPCDEGEKEARLPELKRGNVGSAVLSMQLLLIHKWAISCGVDGADGDFGPNTEKAVKSFQTARKLDVDGICGAMTWTALIGG